MYIICGLIIVKLTHMRQSSVSVSVFAVFISLGVVVFYVVVGIVSSNHSFYQDYSLVPGLHPVVNVSYAHFSTSETLKS